MGKTSNITGIAILADEEEWRALAEQNPLFEFTSYRSYLVDVERRMRAAARAGRQVLVGPLMPDQFETRADAAGLARDSPRALKEYERFVAELGPLTRPWTGEPITQVLERLRQHVRAETLQTRAMSALSAAAALHESPHEAAQQAMAQAAHVIMTIADAAGDGQHALRINVTHPEGDLEYTLPYSRCAKVIAFPDDGGENMAVILLAIASLAERPGTMTLRSRSLPAFFPSRRKPRDKDPAVRASNDAFGPGGAAEAPKAAPESGFGSGSHYAPDSDSGSGSHSVSGSDSHSDSVSGSRSGSRSGSHSHSDSYGSILRGWRLGGLLPQPMSEGQLFAFTCTTPAGDPAPPEPGTRFRAGFPLDRPLTHSPTEETR